MPEHAWISRLGRVLFVTACGVLLGWVLWVPGPALWNEAAVRVHAFRLDRAEIGKLRSAVGYFVENCLEIDWAPQGGARTPSTSACLSAAVAGVRAVAKIAKSRGEGYYTPRPDSPQGAARDALLIRRMRRVCIEAIGGEYSSDFGERAACKGMSDAVYLTHGRLE